MNRAWRRVAAALNLLAAVGGVAIVAALVAAQSIDPADVQARLIAAVESATGRTLQIGTLSLTRSLFPTVTATDVALANLPGGSRPDIAHAERIEAQIALLPLLQHTLELRRLVLTGPNILFEEVGGTPNWLFKAADPTTGGSESGGNAGGGGFALRVASASVRNGMVTWRLPARTKVVGIRTLEFRSDRIDRSIAAGATLVYADNQPFNLDIRATPTGAVSDPWRTRLHFTAFDTVADADGTMSIAGPYDMQVTATAGALEKLNALYPPLALPALHGVNLQARLANGARPGDLPVVGPAALQFGSADLRALLPGLVLGAGQVAWPAAGGTATLDGVGRFGDGAFHLTGTAVVPTHPEGAVQVPVALSVDAGGTGTIGLKGTVATRSLAFAGLDGALTLQTPALARMRPLLGAGLPALTALRVAGQVTVPTALTPIRLRGLSMQSEQGDLAGDGSLDPTNAALSGTWRSKTLDLPAMLTAFGIPLPSAAPASSGPVLPNTPLPWAALRAGSLDLLLAVAALKLDIGTWQDVQGRIALKDGRLEAGPLSVATAAARATATLTADAGSQTASLTVAAPAVPLALLTAAAGLPGGAAGTAALRARLSGTGSTVRALAAGLSGPVGLSTTGGVLDNATLLALAGPALAALSITVPASGRTTIDCLGLNGTFAGGVGTVTALAMQSTYLTVAGKGQIDLRNETVDFELQPFAQVAGSAVAVPVVVKGPFRAVTGGLDADLFGKIGILFDGLFGGDDAKICKSAGSAN